MFPAMLSPCVFTPAYQSILLVTPHAKQLAVIIEHKVSTVATAPYHALIKLSLGETHGLPIDERVMASKSKGYREEHTSFSFHNLRSLWKVSLEFTVFCMRVMHMNAKQAMIGPKDCDRVGTRADEVSRADQ